MVMLAAVICLGVTAGCERTVPGTVAMTTQPGPTTTTRPSTTSRPTASAPTRTSSPTPEVPAPANALTMTCKEFTGLDDATKKAVVKAILDQEKDSPFGMLGTEFAESIASTMCEFLPESTVREVLMGSPPP
jgi:hypothetical protein